MPPPAGPAAAPEQAPAEADRRVSRYDIESGLWFWRGLMVFFSNIEETLWKPAEEPPALDEAASPGPDASAEPAEPEADEKANDEV